jgi:hypothetical protein
MERVGTLINKLKEQFEQHASADKLAVTAQLLLVELQKNRSQSSISSKVSVVLPSVSGTLFNEQAEQNATSKPASKQEESANSWLFETNAEIPTMAHQDTYKETSPTPTPVPKEIFEFNKTLANEVESLNEKLKEDRIEVVSTLQGTPVRDLKKAIGVNDRYLFVHDLFRGDENMYERSIKTINGFSIYPEAQYWIQRELKVKLSWPDNSETVKLFDQLIKRRFS